MKYHFFSGFETGGLDNFTSASGSVQSSVKRKGIYAGDNEDNENFLKTLDTGQSTIYMSGWFRWSVPPPSQSIIFVGDGPSNGQFMVRLYNLHHFWVTPWGNGQNYFFYIDGAIEINKWYFIELKFVVHDTNGLFELRLNAGLVGSKTGIDTKNIDSTVKTFKWQGINWGAGHCYVDNCGIADNWAYDYGWIVSKAGVDVANASVHQSKFGSNWDTLKIKQQQYNSITTNGAGDGLATIPHGLGYKPAFMVFAHKNPTDTVDGVSFNNANFISGSGQFTPFYYDTAGVNQSLRDIVGSSDVNNINLKIKGPASKNYKIYTYTMADLAEETSQSTPTTSNHYGLRVSQKGYDVKTAPDYRMIYSSKYRAFHIIKTGTFPVDMPGETIGSGGESLTYQQRMFSDLGISNGYHPYMVMIPDMDISMASPAYIWLDGGYVR